MAGFAIAVVFPSVSNVDDNIGICGIIDAIREIEYCCIELFLQDVEQDFFFRVIISVV